MTRINVAYPDFSSGEISPKVYGRFDIAAAYSGMRRMENFIPETVGMAKYRSGSVFLAKTKNNQQAVIQTFNYSESLSFILEFTDQSLRFYMDNARVQEPSQSITNVTQSNPAVVSYSGDDNFSDGDSVYITNISGMVELNNAEYTVANVDVGANTFELSGVDSSTYGAYASGGDLSVITEIATPFLIEDLPQLKFSPVVNGVMYIAHPDYNPQQLTFTSPTSWTMSDHTPTALTLTTGNRPSAVGVYEQRLVYGSSDNNNNRIWMSVSGDFDDFTTGTSATSALQYDIAGNVGRISWISGTSDFLAIGTTEDIYRVTGGIDEVITIDSISIKPTNSFGVANIMPINRGSQIFYMQNNNLTLRSFEYDIRSNGFRPVDRNTISDHITSSGVGQITFQEGRPNIVWAVKNNGTLIGMTFDDSESVTGWHRHSTDGYIRSIATLPRTNNYNQLWQCVERVIDGVSCYYIEYYSDYINYVRREDYINSTDGSTKNEDEELFENLIFENQKEYIHLDSSLSYYGDLLGLDAGVSVTPSAITGDSVEFIASGAIFTSDMVGRQIWRRSVTGNEIGRAEITSYNSTTSVTCSILEDFDSSSEIPSGQWFLTAGEFSGIDHLEGKTVSVVADGGQHEMKTVLNGKISLDTQASVVHVGLAYKGVIETNDLEGGGTNGTAQTKRKSLYAVGIRFLDSLFARYGAGYYNLNLIHFRDSYMRMDRPPTLFTGVMKQIYSNQINDSVDGGWAREKRVVIVQDQPFPCNIQLIIPYINVSN